MTPLGSAGPPRNPVRFPCSQSQKPNPAGVASADAWTVLASTLRVRRGQPRRSGFSGGCAGPRFEPARLLAADAPGAGRIKMAQVHLSSSLLRAPGLRGLVVKGSGTTYPEPRTIQPPATAHFFGSKGDRVTRNCDTGAPTADQD